MNFNPVSLQAAQSATHLQNINIVDLRWRHRRRSLRKTSAYSLHQFLETLQSEILQLILVP
jgi:recombinational DNA repair protein (RecF pathway)